jgi:Fe-S-cluster containining protein
MSDLPERRAKVGASYATLVDLLPKVTNVGGTWDERDLYWVMEKATEVAIAVHPDFLCRSGCTHCCRGDNVVMVTSVEWRLLYPHLYGLPDAVRRAIVRDTKETWGPILHTLLAGKAGYRVDGKLRIVPREMQATIHCPLLVHNKCSAYAARPFQCRSYGNFAINTGKPNAIMYMCEPAESLVMETFPADTALPILNPYRAKLMTLEGENPVYAFLPLWIAAHIEGADLSPICVLQPDFEAAVARFQAVPAKPKKKA